MYPKLVVLFRHYIAIGFLLFSSLIFGQQLKGKVFDGMTKKPIENVLVSNETSGKWTITDKEGRFLLAVNHYPTTITIHFLGKQKQTLKINQKTSYINVYLLDDNFKLGEVVVTAGIDKKAIGSTVVLGKKAIELVQAQSLADVVQLIPGKSIAESDLHKRQLLTLRSAVFRPSDVFNNKKGLVQFNSDFLINNSFGVGYLINDIPLNNNAELSGNRGLVYGAFSNINDFASVGYGVDLRDFSLENIESIEVIQGISSVRYGDHSTGLVKIEKKVGKTPYRIYTTLRGGAYSVQVGKGIALPKWGFMNFGVEYLHSNEDPRSVLSKYDRITLSARWKYFKKRTFKNIFSISYVNSLNGKNTERSKTVDRSKSLKKKKIRLNNKSNFYFESSYIDNLETALSLDYTDSDTKHEQLVNSGGRPVMGSLKEGTFRLGYSPVSYTTLEEVNNIPISFFSRVEANKKWITSSENTYKISLGMNLVLEDNIGKGTVYNKDRLPLYAGLSSSNSGNMGWRNVNFRETLPTEIQFSTYLNTISKIQLLERELYSEIGIRYDNYNGKSALSPRANFKFKWNEHWSTRLGGGLFSKAPALQFIYNFPSYHDFLLADFRNNHYSFALGHTLIRNRPKNDIKPSRMWKSEIGVDYSSSLVNVALTGYMNKLYDGFSTVIQFENVKIPKYEFTFYPKKEPDYKQVGETDYLLDYRQNTNGISSFDAGVEWMLNTKKISLLKTSFNFSMAYRYTNNRVVYPYAYYDKKLNFHKIPEQERASKKYQYIRLSGSNSVGVNTYIPRIFGNYHLKVSKQFENGLQFSFYAINFLNYLPKVEVVSSTGELVTKRLNAPISFGGNITYKF